MRNKRTLVPRTRESVNRQLDAETESNRFSSRRGDYCINPNLKNVRHIKPECYKKGKTVIRIWPMLDPEDPANTLLNGRLSTQGVAGLGGMSISEPAYCASYVGITKEHGNFLSDPKAAEPCSYIIARDKEHVVDGINFWEEPYVKLQVTAKRAMQAGEFGHGGAWDPKWNKLLPPANMAALNPFRQFYFVVCSVYENGPRLDLIREHVEYQSGSKAVVKDYPRDGIPLGENPADPLIVMQMSVSAGKNLLKLPCIEKKNWSGSEDLNPSVMFKYGDPTGIFNIKDATVAGGVFFTIYNPDVCKDEFKYTTFTGAVPVSGIVGYEAAISTKYAGPDGILVPDLTREQVDNIINKHVFLWKDSPKDPADSYLLHIPSIEERCVMLAKAFKPVAKLVEFCWMSNPEYMRFESVRGILSNRKSVVATRPPMDEEEEEDAEADVSADEDDDVPVSPKVAAKVKPSASTPPPKKKTAAALADEFDDDDLPEDEVDDVDFDDEEVAPPKSVKSKAPVKPAGKAKPAVEVIDDDELEDDDELDEDDLDDDDDEAAEEDADSKDFDVWDDEADNTELEDQLNSSLSKAKAIARSRKRTAAPAPVENPPTRRRTK